MISPKIKIESIDHFVLTVADIEATCEFYAQVLGMEIITFGEGRKGLRFGQQKINLHQAGREFEPKAAYPTPGTADFCLIASGEITAVIAHLTHCGLPIIAGPVARSGAVGPITSVYIRDPDQNLIEIATY